MNEPLPRSCPPILASLSRLSLTRSINSPIISSLPLHLSNSSSPIPRSLSTNHSLENRFSQVRFPVNANMLRLCQCRPCVPQPIVTKRCLLPLALSHSVSSPFSVTSASSYPYARRTTCTASTYISDPYLQSSRISKQRWRCTHAYSHANAHMNVVCMPPIPLECCIVLDIERVPRVRCRWKDDTAKSIPPQTPPTILSGSPCILISTLTSLSYRLHPFHLLNLPTPIHRPPLYP